MTPPSLAGQTLSALSGCGQRDYLHLCIPVYESSKQRMHLTQTVLERETLELSWRDLNLAAMSIQIMILLCLILQVHSWRSSAL